MRGERRCGGGGGGGSASTNGGPRSAELLFQPLCTHRVFGVYGVARDGDTHGRARRTTPHRLAHRTVSRIAPFARYARTEAPSIAARARAHRPHSRPSRVDACLARRAADASSATHAHYRAPSPLRARTHHTTHRRRRHRRRRPLAHAGCRPKSASPTRASSSIAAAAADRANADRAAADRRATARAPPHARRVRAPPPTPPPNRRRERRRYPLAASPMRAAAAAARVATGAAASSSARARCEPRRCVRHRARARGRRAASTTSASSSASSSASTAPTLAASDPRAHDTMSTIQEYIEKHDLSKKVEEALNAAVKARPEEPMAFMVRRRRRRRR